MTLKQQYDQGRENNLKARVILPDGSILDEEFKALFVDNEVSTDTATISVYTDLGNKEEIITKKMWLDKIPNVIMLNDIKQKLVDLGYVRYELIDGRGQFSVRGGIVDISITEKTGIRIEFWGDEIDSIRYFNISSQRSTADRS